MKNSQQPERPQGFRGKKLNNEKHRLDFASPPACISLLSDATSENRPATQIASDNR
jgi:hypothetical protein